MAAELRSFFDFVHSNEETYVKRLAEAVAIASVSSDASMRNKVFEMGDWIFQWAKNLGGEVQKVTSST